MMRISLFVLALLPASYMSVAQRAYSSADTMRAYTYYDTSWHYGMNTLRHQQYLDSALMVMPTQAYFWQQKSMPLYKQGKWQVARPYLDSAAKYDPHRWLDYRAFMRCIYERNYRDALADLYAVKALPGNNSAVMDHPYDFYIGLCHLQLNEIDSSLYYLNNVVADEVNTHGEKWVHYNYLYYLGIAYYEKTDYAAALACFDRALALYIRFSDAKYYKGMCLHRLGREPEAAEAITGAWIDSKEGYTMNEDNAVYERYPYQLRKEVFEQAAKMFTKDAVKSN